MPMPDSIRNIPKPMGQLKKPRDDKPKEVTSNKVTFTTEEADLLMSALQVDEEVILADKVNRGMQKLNLLKDYIAIKQNENTDDEDN